MEISAKKPTASIQMIKRYITNLAMGDGPALSVSTDGIATVRLNNGENRVRLSSTKAWLAILDQIERDPDIKGLVITGSGKYFSLGLDLDYIKTQTSEYFEETRRLNGILYLRLMYLPIPTVAAINGHTYGAGSFLALACDYRVMRSDRGWICWPEVNLEMVIGPTGYQLLRQKLQCGAPLRDTTLLGKRLTVEDALALQLVDEVADLANLETVAKRLITSILGPNGISREALRQAKRDVYPEDDNSSLNQVQSNL